MEQAQSDNLFDLHLDHQSSSYLNESAKWAKFLSIVGFVVCGLIVLLGIFAGSFLASSFGRLGGEAGAAGAGGGAVFSIMYILFALLYFFPCLYLFRFASKMQAALRGNDQQVMNTSFANLKSMFKFMGILTIIMLSLYAIFFIFAMLAVGFRA